MKVLIFGKDMPHSIDCANAFYGFEDMGADITLSVGWPRFSDDVLREFDCCVGGVDVCHYALGRMGIRDYRIPCYPTELNEYLFRTIGASTIKRFVRRRRIKPAFIKPVKPKLFTGFVYNGDQRAILLNLGENEPIYVSDIIEFKSEWRVYVFGDKVQSIAHYNGNPSLFPDCVTIKKMIKAWKGPACYTLDVGVTVHGTALVEINDFYAIGNYGMPPYDYANMLWHRWQELKSRIPKKESVKCQVPQEQNVSATTKTDVSTQKCQSEDGTKL